MSNSGEEDIPSSASDAEGRERGSREDRSGAGGSEEQREGAPGEAPGVPDRADSPVAFPPQTPLFHAQHTDRMSKTLFWTLNLGGGICVLLIVINLVLAQMDVRLNKTVAFTQNQFNQAQRLQNTAQNLVGRLAQAAQTDAALNHLLARHNFKVNLNTNAPGVATP